MAVVKRLSAPKAPEREVEMVALKELYLDPSNPRFGDHAGKATQEQVMERIVNQFGIDDLLASLGVSGYFVSEPLVARRDKNRLVVVEGNRRLAACLILARDPRATVFSERRPTKPKTQWGADTQVPVLVFEPSEQRSLLPYLGIRHIVGSQAWDSYAKARWINEVVLRGDMTLEEIAEAIGDSNRTVFRMLDGYRFINQLIDAGRFVPDESHRRGRGSNPEYPFSWVYTLLDYSPVRDHLGLSARREVTAKDKKPVAAKNEGAAAKAVLYMFGSRDRPPAIGGSRQISDLADALADPIKRVLLDQGRSVEEIVRQSRSAPDQLAELVRTADESLRSAVGVVGAQALTQIEADPFVKPTLQVRQLARDLYERIKKVALPDDDADA